MLGSSSLASRQGSNFRGSASFSLMKAEPPKRHFQAEPWKRVVHRVPLQIE